MWHVLKGNGEEGIRACYQSVKGHLSRSHAPKFPLSLISFFLLMPITQATYDGVQAQINSIKIN